MKNFLLFLLWAFMSFGARAQGLSNDIKLDLNDAIETAYSEMMICQPSDLCIPIQAHVFYEPGATDYPNLALLNTYLTNLNYYFQETGISFFWKDVPDISANADLANYIGANDTGVNGNEYTTVESGFTSEAFNVFFVSSVELDIARAGVSFAVDDSENFIFNTPESLVILLDYNIYSVQPAPFEAMLISQMFAHEIGHSLGLMHTHAGIQCGDCLTTGDKICDTPSDPEANYPINFDYDCDGLDCNCDFFEEQYDACIAPSMTNLMSYYQPCIKEFTPDQIDKLICTLETREFETSYNLDLAATTINMPQNFSVSAFYDNLIFSWTDVASEIGYFIERSDDGSFFYPVFSSGTAKDANSITIPTSTLSLHNTQGDFAWFRLRAVNGECNITSNTICIGFTSTVPLDPGMPNTNSPELISSATPTLTWSAVVGVAGYNLILEKEQAGGSFAEILSVTCHPTNSLTLEDGLLEEFSTYRWRVGCGFSNSCATCPSANSYYYYFETQTFTDPNCTPLPIVEAGADPTINQGESIQLNAIGAFTYVWNPVIGLDNATIPNPIASPTQTTTYTVTGTNAEGCQDTDQITVFVQGIGLNPPANDNCDGAININVQSECSTQTFTLTDATDSGIEIPLCDSPGNIDVWFSFTVPADGYVSLFTDNETIPSGDVGAAFYTGDCGTLEEIRCIKNGNGAMPADEYINLVDYAGEQMFLRIWEYGTEVSQGDFSICLYTEPLYPDKVIVAYEYWYDDDYADNNFHYVNPTPVLNLNTDFETDGLSLGLHVLHFRSMDSYGDWSSTLSRFINTATSIDAEMVEYEYWFDGGYAEKISTTVSATEVLNVQTDFDTDSLTKGLHVLHFRAKDNNDQWSSTLSRFINTATSIDAQIVGYEYWFDDAYLPTQYVSVEAAQVVDITSSMDCSAINDGLHVLHFRAKDSNDQWSSTLSRFIHKLNFTASPNIITGFEYWFDDDYASKIAGTISTSENPYTYTQNVSAISLDLGSHDFRIRFNDSGNQWSAVYSIQFNKIAHCLGDFDINMAVNVSDLLIFTSGFSCTNDCGIVDLTGDGVVNVSDLLIFTSVFGEDCE